MGLPKINECVGRGGVSASCLGLLGVGRTAGGKVVASYLEPLEVGRDEGKGDNAFCGSGLPVFGRSEGRGGASSSFRELREANGDWKRRGEVVSSLRLP